MKKETVSNICDQILFWGVLLAVFVMPFEQLMPFASSSDALKEAGLLIPLLCWIVKMIIERRILFVRTPLDIFILFYVLACVVSTVFSIDTQFSIKTIRKELISYLLLFYVIVNNFDEKKIKWVLYIFLLGGLIVCVYGASNYLYKFNMKAERICGTFNQPNRYAQYLIILSSLIVTVIAIVRSRKWKFIFGIFFILSLLNLFWSFSRAGWIAFLAAMAVFFIEASRKTQIAIIFSIVLLTMGIVFTNKGKERLTSLVGDERLLIYNSAINVIYDYPITGVGYGDKNFLKIYKSKYKSEKAVVDHSGTHNIFLQVAVETGFIGLIAFILLHLKILLTMISLYRQHISDDLKWILLWGISSFVGVFTIGQLHTLYRDRNVFIFWIIVAVMMVIWKKVKEDVKDSQKIQ